MHSLFEGARTIKPGQNLLRELFKGAIISRAWNYQGNTVHRHSPHLYCGKLFVNWEYIYACTLFINSLLHTFGCFFPVNRKKLWMSWSEDWHSSTRLCTTSIKSSVNAALGLTGVAGQSPRQNSRSLTDIHPHSPSVISWCWPVKKEIHSYVWQGGYNYTV